jgi:methyl-accepting chemotaxis protein
MNYWIKYLLNPGLKEETERVFEGIASGRVRELNNWFEDKWLQLELVKDSIHNQFERLESVDHQKLNTILAEKQKQFKEFSEFFIINEMGDINISSASRQRGKNVKTTTYFQKAMSGDCYMYGPYTDSDTLEIGNCHSKFFDEVTLMFAMSMYNARTKRKSVLCGRIPNDVMSDVIQEEDTHVFKESGDNYLFMVKSARDIPVGTAISRSRFEDNTFSLGDNLKEGIRTKKWGTVQIQKHTEFEIIFNDPATEKLHEGVEKTIQQGSNLEAWPGYPEYRHILVGGKGVLIHPPHSDEVWGMMCEGDIEEIYKFTSLNVKVPMIIGGLNLLLFLAQWFGSGQSNPTLQMSLIALPWIVNTIFVALLTRHVLVKPIKNVTRTLQKVAEGAGDLSLRLPFSHHDEIGDVAKWFNKFLSSQMQTIKRAGTVSHTSTDSAKTLKDLSGSIQSEAPEVAGGVQQIIENLNRQNQVFEITKDKFIKLTDEAETIAKTITYIEEHMKNTNEDALKSIDASNEVLITMDQLEKEMSKATESMQTLNTYSQKISEVVSTIDKIAKQTQLLALNATIESARAGEAGKGFGVVAENISQLALESARATVSIGELITDVQKETVNTDTSIQQIAKKVVYESESVQDTIETFKSIQKQITEVSENTTQIAKLIESQTIDFDSINQEMSATADDLQDGALESQISSENVLKSIQHIFTETNEINELSKTLLVTSTNMNNIVDGFTLLEE